MIDLEQFDVVNTRQWYTDFRTAAGTIISALTTAHASIQGDDAWLATEVGGVAARFKIVGNNVHAQVALLQGGEWMYDWKFPIGWVTT